MTKLLDHAVEFVRRLSPASQDEIAQTMLALADDDELQSIDPTHLPDILAGLAEARRKEFASDAEVAAAFQQFDA